MKWKIIYSLKDNSFISKKHKNKKMENWNEKACEVFIRWLRWIMVPPKASALLICQQWKLLMLPFSLFRDFSFRDYVFLHTHTHTHKNPGFCIIFYNLPFSTLCRHQTANSFDICFISMVFFKLFPFSLTPDEF